MTSPIFKAYELATEIVKSQLEFYANANLVVTSYRDPLTGQEESVCKAHSENAETNSIVSTGEALS